MEGIKITIMATTKRVNWYLDEDAIALAEQLADSENKKGDFVSKAIRAYAAAMTVGDEPDVNECGVQESILARLARIESRITRIEAKL